MREALLSLGTRIDSETDDWIVLPGQLPGDAEVDCGLAGTVMRFVAPVAALHNGRVSFDGDDGARARPMAEVLRVLRALGVRIDGAEQGTMPFTVCGKGGVRGGEISIDGSASSQFISALLLVGAKFDEGLVLTHDGEAIPSLPHIEMTVERLRNRGVEVDDSIPHQWRILPGPIAAVDVDIEPDLSNAAPFLMAAMISGGSVVVTNWPRKTTQAGDHLRHILAQMGATFEFVDAGLKISGSGEFSGIDVDLHEVGELTPAIAALCSLANSPSRIRGVQHIRGHETDRLHALRTELRGLGGDVDETDDGLIIRPRKLSGGLFHTYADHRMAHAGLIIGLRVAGVTVENVTTTGKTFPGFEHSWNDLVSA